MHQTTHKKKLRHRPANLATQKKSNSSAATMQDQRATSIAQRKLQGLADRSPQAQQTAQRQALVHNFAKANQGVTQLVLRNNTAENRRIEAALIDAYHKAEENGDAISLSNKSVSEQQKAINYYKTAKNKRRKAGRMHLSMDGGHIGAIAVLDTKIRARRTKIQAINTQKATGKKPKRPALRGYRG